MEKTDFEICEKYFFRNFENFQNPLGILRFSLPRYKENLKIPKGFWKFLKIPGKIFFQNFKNNFLHDKIIFFIQFFLMIWNLAKLSIYHTSSVHKLLLTAENRNLANVSGKFFFIQNSLGKSEPDWRTCSQVLVLETQL